MTAGRHAHEPELGRHEPGGTARRVLDAGSSDMKHSVTTRIRRLAVTAGVTVGLVATTAGPAAAGLMLGNHCPPPAVRAD
jgi:hypothetical protein